jgi:hypothetical protein
VQRGEHDEAGGHEHDPGGEHDARAGRPVGQAGGEDHGDEARAEHRGVDPPQREVGNAPVTQKERHDHEEAGDGGVEHEDPGVEDEQRAVAKQRARLGPRPRSGRAGPRALAVHEVGDEPRGDEELEQEQADQGEHGRGAEHGGHAEA